MDMKKTAAGFVCALFAGTLASSADAQSVSSFYSGKQLNLIVGYPAGTGYDFYSRLLARYYAKHIPGSPTIVVQNMVGAASLKAVNYLYKAAPRDGTAIAAINRSVAMMPLLQTIDLSNIQFDAMQFGWIGSISKNISIGFVRAESGITSFDEVFKRQIVVSSVGPSSDSYMLANMLNNLLGTKLKIITGYPGSDDNFLAVERGEVDGYFGSSFDTLETTRPDWLPKKKINVLIQIALEKHPDHPDIPLVTEFAKTETDHKALDVILAPLAASRPYLGPPGMPTDRLAALRTAFMETMEDPAFLAEAKKSHTEVSPMTGQEVEDMVRTIYGMPKDAIAAAQAALKLPEGVKAD
jgi:tripartite-type tricarboxylate transporter receptor subunit TctC